MAFLRRFYVMGIAFDSPPSCDDCTIGFPASEIERAETYAIMLAITKDLHNNKKKSGAGDIPSVTPNVHFLFIYSWFHLIRLVRYQLCIRVPFLLVRTTFLKVTRASAKITVSESNLANKRWFSECQKKTR